MSIFYSATRNQFYSSEDFQSDAMPADALEVSEDLYAECVAAYANNKIVKASPDGLPMVIDQPAPTAAELAAQTLIRRDELLKGAALRIAPFQDAVDIGEATDEETALLKRWKQYRVALNRLQDQAGYPQTITWPSAPDA